VGNLDAPSKCRDPFTRAYDPLGTLVAEVTVRS
jgi:hypothetical protein